MQLQLKSLKKKWGKLRPEARRTGNDTDEPLELTDEEALLRDYFGDKLGMMTDSLFTTDTTSSQSSELLDFDPDDILSVDSDNGTTVNSSGITGDDQVESNPRKRTMSEFSGHVSKRSNGQYIESGLNAMADGLKTIGNAIAAKRTGDSASTDQIIAALSMQTAEIHRQSDALNALVAILTQQISKQNE